MLRHNDFSACVFVDGKELEYFEPRVKFDDSEDGSEVMHAYIIGEPGKNFTVSWKDHRGVHGSSGHIFIDGKDVASAIIRPGRGKPVSRSGVKIAATKLRLFRFANLNITADDALADKKKDKERLKEMSTIRLAITYVQLGDVVPFKSQEVHDWGHVHEASRRCALCSAFDTKIAIPASRSVASRPLNPDRPGPDVQFVFTYATREHLMAADIVPNPRAPRIGPQDTIILDDEDDEGEDRPRLQPRNNKRAQEGSGVGAQKRTRLDAPDGQSSPEAAAPQNKDEDLAELQRYMDEYNLRNSQSEGQASSPRPGANHNNGRDDSDSGSQEL